MSMVNEQYLRTLRQWASAWNRTILSAGFTCVLIFSLFLSPFPPRPVQAAEAGALAPDPTHNLQAMNIYYVDAATGNDTTGSGTPAAPWRTITYALGQITAPTAELHAAPGTYDEALGESFPIVMKSGVSLMGASYTATVISGNSSSAVIHFPSTAVYTASTVISGFKIRGGLAGVRVDGAADPGARPTIQANWITENTDGIYSQSSSGWRAAPTIRANLIANNTANGIYASTGDRNAAFSPTIQDNQIVDNGNTGLHCYADGYSGMEHSTCSALIASNLIARNDAHGVECRARYAGRCDWQLVNNKIADNQGWGIYRSNDLIEYWTTSTPKLIGNLIYGNLSGGALAYISDEPLLVNNTITANGPYGVWSSPASSGVRKGWPTIVNTILWGHADDLNVPVDYVTYSTISEAGYAGANNNISIDPQFTDPGHQDYHLRITSPMVNAGSSAQPDIPAADIDGDARLAGSSVDIGADEAAPYYVAATQAVEPASAAPGETVTYTLTITNLGTSLAAGVVITDQLPLETTWAGQATTNPGLMQVNGNGWTWQGSLAPSQTQAIAYRATVNPGRPIGEIVTDTATIIGWDGLVTETVPAAFTVAPGVLWNSSKQAVSHAYASPGQRLTYTLSLSNTGSMPATEVVVTDTLDSALTFAGASDGAVFDTDRVVWSGLTFAPGASLALTLAVTVNMPLADATAIVNPVRLTASGQPVFDLPLDGAVSVIYNPVQADFSVTPTAGPAPLTVTFDNDSLHGTGALWSYGDGSTSAITAETHSHTYDNPGVYTVTLQALNPVGVDSVTRTSYITAQQAPLVSFDGSPQTGAVPLTVTFTNSSLYGDQFMWRYGDGQTATTTATTHTHTYAATGVFTVSLTASNAYATRTLTRTGYIGVYPPLVIDFSAAPLTGTAPLTVSFLNNSQNADYFWWSFGDGNYTSAISPTHVYATSGIYTVRLQAWNPGGSGELNRADYITAYGPPRPAFTGDPLVGLGSLTTIFTNTSQLADRYVWDYGDGQTSAISGATHSHFYAAPGVYTVTLAAINTYGVVTKTRVAYAAVYTTPTPAFTAVPLAGSAPLTVAFTNASAGATGYLWSFGDGAASSASAPTHTYTASGYYTVTLTASNPLTFATLTRPGYIKIYDFTVTDVVPEGNGALVTPTATISAAFNRSADPAAITSHSFAVRGRETGIYTGTYTPTPDNRSVQFRPARAFRPGETILATLSSDLLTPDGVGLKPYAWQFQAQVKGGSGLMSNSGQALGYQESHVVALGDLDRDGDLDAFVGNFLAQPNEVWLNNGRGNFSLGQSMPSTRCYDAALGDLDGDGDLDAFVTSTPNKVWLNDGAGTFTDTGQSPGNSTGVALGDVDGDGDLDAVLGNDEQSIEVWLNDGTGVFGESQSLTGATRNYDVALGDLDGDGDLDLFAPTLGPVAGTGAPDQVWFNDGQGHFVDSGQRLGDALSVSVALGDLDGDGDLDAFVGMESNQEQPNEVWLNDGRGYFSLYQNTINSAYTFNVALGDVDGDGDLDAFIANTGAGEIWLNDGTGQFSLGQGLDLFYSRDVALGDLDDDGDLDAFVVADGYVPSENVNTVWLNQDSAIAGLAAANDSPTPLGQMTHLSAAIDSGSVSTYTWALGDGTGGNGAEVSHLYTSAGTYTAMVTAANSTGLLTATTVVTITDIPPLSIPSFGRTITPTEGVTIAAGNGVFSDTVLIAYTPRPITATDPLSNANLFFELSASYLSSGLPAQPQPGQSYTISVTYQQENVPAGVDEAGLALYYWDEVAWVKEPSSVADGAANTVTAAPDHFSLWAVLAQGPGVMRTTYLPVILKR
jgi:uncharacterized repeat protein (TIGR01451 family)